MRWRSRLYLKDRLGDERVRERFCFVPWIFDRYWYWLQPITVVERVKEIDVGGTMQWGVYAYRWRPDRLAESVSESAQER